MAHGHTPVYYPMTKSSLPENVITLHREVHRKFGRNLLRLQQYEKLVKILVAEQTLSGNVNDLGNARSLRHETVANKTLGQVVGDLVGNFIAPAKTTTDSIDNDEDECDPTLPFFQANFRIEFSEENFKRTKQNLTNLVDLRNELVHHFLDKHDLMTEPGCLAADAYLDECFKQIDAYWIELQQWAKHSDDLRTQLASYMKTPEFRDFIKHGIMPGNAGVLWASCTIVNLLRDAEAALAKEGWTLLSNAIAYIGMREAEHTPKKYGCSSWRHVLHESKQFELRKVQVSPVLPTEIWYRSRPV